MHAKTDVKAITVVDGNVGVERGVENTKIILNLTGKLDVPVYRGAETPIIDGLGQKVCWPGHASDGLGGFTNTKEWEAFTSQYMPEISPIKLEDEIAASALVRMVSEKPGVYTLLALGPLTNLAVAILIDPKFLFKLKRLVVMGGCLNARGNSNRVAEFNFHCDPEAVHIVLQASTAVSLARPSAPPLLEIVPWETTVEHGIPWTFFDSLVAQGGALAAFLRGYASAAESLGRAGQLSLTRKVGMRTCVENHLIGANTFLMCDIYAAIAVLEPKSILSVQDWDAKIELGGTHSRGLLAMEWFGSVGAANARFITTLDREIIRSLLERTFAPSKP
ncbi:hypothetical protein HDU67_006660 [Dinochytrium kinnereticum]|nr:hypothetical protein HDU67_006660 [Dinochytrium kinnereticum]